MRGSRKTVYNNTVVVYVYAVWYYAALNYSVNSVYTHTMHAPPRRAVLHRNCIQPTNNNNKYGVEFGQR